MTDGFVISKNLSLLDGRIRAAMATDAPKRLKECLSSMPDRVLTVGTGGSYASALFAAKAISAFERSIAVSARPRDALLRGVDKYDLVILFSYSGTTPDIREVVRVCDEKGVKTLLITALDPLAEGCPCAAEDVVSYGVSEPDFEEKGFISMASTLIPICLFADRYYGKGFEKMYRDVFEAREKEFRERRILGGSERPLMIDVFSAYDTETASAVLESDITESGIGRATVHEKKDFSHGRYNALEGSRSDVAVFLNNAVGAYTETLIGYLRSRNYPLFEITTERSGIWGDFDLTVAAQFFVTKLSEETGYDMSDPTYPVEAKSLYKYIGDLL